MEPVELLAYVTAALDATGIGYLLCGSMASIHYGEPRYTHDIDLVIDLQASQVQALQAHFASDDWYFDDAMARTEIARGGMFKFLHIASGLKIDCYLLRTDSYAQAQWSGRVSQSMGEGLEVTIARPEDVIIMKLVYYREGGSDKHLRDIASILTVQHGRLDMAYLDEWSERLGVRPIWQGLQP